MFPGFPTHFDDCPDFFACVFSVIIVEYIFEHSEVVFALCAVHIIVDGDKTDVIGGENEILKTPHIGILPAKAGEVFDNQGGNRIVLHIFHHFLKAGSLKIRS